MHSLSLIPRNLLIADSNCTVPCSSCNRIEFEVLFEAATGWWCVCESLFLQMNGEIVEGRDHETWDSEWETSHADLGSVPSACKWDAKDDSAGNVIQTIIGISKTWVCMGHIWLQTYATKFISKLSYRVSRGYLSALEKVVFSNCSYFYIIIINLDCLMDSLYD